MDIQDILTIGGYIIIGSISLVIVLLFLSYVILYYFVLPMKTSARIPPRNGRKTLTIGFFHPYCNAGGGGERVLWCALQAMANYYQIQQQKILKNNKNKNTNNNDNTTEPFPYLQVVIYTGDIDATPAAILQKVKERFNITLPVSFDLSFVKIRSRTYLEAWRYPRFTLLGQALGSLYVAIDCLCKYNPDIWIDTTGAAFTFFIARIARCKIGCYVHYPMISTDMLARVLEKRPDYNNNETISSSVTLTTIKYYYYQLFAHLYSYVGKLSDMVTVNGHWTKAHIDQLWDMTPITDDDEEEEEKKNDKNTDDNSNSNETKDNVSRTTSGSGKKSNGTNLRQRPSSSSSSSASSTPSSPSFKKRERPLSSSSSLFSCCQRKSSSSILLPRPSAYVVYPPCNTTEFQSLPFLPRQRTIVSIGQFRPEKDHPLQIRSFAVFRQRNLPLYGDIRLQLIGGVRDEGDEQRVQNLRSLVEELHLTEVVDFCTNLPFPQLKQALGNATATIHTMWNEHFGIGVVESMAAGAVTIAHNSGGPQCDIVIPYRNQPTGFLAATPEEYANVLEEIFGKQTPPVSSSSSSPSSSSSTVKLSDKGKTANELLQIVTAARASVERFSDEEFGKQWMKNLLPLLLKN